MGCANSKPATLSTITGDGADFLERYTLDRKIGEGEYGVVKIVRENKQSSSSNTNGTQQKELACKILKKGRVFKDNVLYAPLSPEMLRSECDILSRLSGKHHNLKLHGLYESPSNIYIVTEYCSGGEMMQYVDNWYGESGLRIEDLRRIGFQLVDAVGHCARSGVIHRDIKPENIMFVEGRRGSQLRLIDFGSGTIDSDTNTNGIITVEQADGRHLQKHATFAGSAFYISPEMFQKDYTCKTDVWSMGVTLYVLVAGYPVDALQKAFNALQNTKSTDRREELRTLPNMPPDMPDSFFELLEQCLTKHTRRSNAVDVLRCTFLDFPADMVQDADGNEQSALIEGTKDRHAYFLQYEKYERAVTTLLASMLRKAQLQQLLTGIDAFIDTYHIDHQMGEESAKTTPADYEAHANNKRLQIITIQELRTILSQLNMYEVISTMENIPSDVCYKQFAYHIALLRQFVTYQDETTPQKSNDTITNSALDDSQNSIGRKWKKVINLRSKYKNSTTDGTTDDATKNTASNESIRTVEADDMLDHSVGNAKVWDEKRDLVSKMGGGGMTRMGGGGMTSSKGSGGMRRNFSTPVLTDLSAYPTLA